MPLPHPATVDAVKAALLEKGIRTVSHELGMHHTTLSRVARGEKVSERALHKLGRLAPKVRSASEFSPGEIRIPPLGATARSEWSVDSVRSAQLDQLSGRFNRPSQLAEAVMCNDAIFTAFHARIAPQNSLSTSLRARGGVRGEAVARKAAQCVSVPRETLKGIHGTLVQHGIAVGRNTIEVDESGTTVTIRHEEWPLRFVQWDGSNKVLWTRTSEDSRVEIHHGDGEWVIYRKSFREPWAVDACLLPITTIWPAHAEGIASWGSSVRTHGAAKILGELPLGVDLTDSCGNLTPVAQAYLNLLKDVLAGDADVGIVPSGSKPLVLTSLSTASQVFTDLVNDRTKAAARVYLGTDAILGAQGGAPGVDISALFGVATTLLQSDLGAIERALKTGVYEPWTAMQEGDSRYAPEFVYEIPDPDQHKRAQEYSERINMLSAAIGALRAQQVEVTQILVDTLVKELGLSTAIALQQSVSAGAQITLDPNDIAKVVRVGEAREAQGLPLFGDERDNMTITELAARAPAAPAV